MARPLKLEFPNAIYHVTARGNARSDIFLDDEDRELLLACLGEVLASGFFLLMRSAIQLRAAKASGSAELEGGNLALLSQAVGRPLRYLEVG
jgi:hypothetical protein